MYFWNYFYGKIIKATHQPTCDLPIGLALMGGVTNKKQSIFLKIAIAQWPSAADGHSSKHLWLPRVTWQVMLKTYFPAKLGARTAREMVD